MAAGAPIVYHPDDDDRIARTYIYVLYITQIYLSHYTGIQIICPRLNDTTRLIENSHVLAKTVCVFIFIFWFIFFYVTLVIFPTGEIKKSYYIWRIILLYTHIFIIRVVSIINGRNTRETEN